MQLAIDTNRKALTMEFTIETAKAQPIHITVRDAYKPFSAYLDRSGIVNGKRTFKVMMPLSPTTAVVEIYNEKNGNRPVGVDKTFAIRDRKIKPLVTQFNAFDTSNFKLLNFLQFAKEFSEQVPIISAGKSVYMSNDGIFRIDYLDVIRDTDRFIPNGEGRMVSNPRYGQIINTPARISHEDGRIEISKDKFLRYTIPMRIVILLHEFSHFYLNRNIDDETEADLNASLVALSIGLPRVEIHKAFTEIFKTAPTDLNRRRLDKIIYFIDNFEKFNFRMAA